ncbi:hypothetical protein CS022_22440 [Veronia nyctiphanis]|uniref:Uncharacterized protein n=1 Tax=Veronia nyctiphanis TaxID=1278244 RepID=A0A4Q0YJF5_9GAMM|nr:hypothetical protein [Veronia nyctiphanis]RXJ70786.1 hypothetical protein CS022_22440 [Veronia nyctiphanis]
MTLFGLLWTIHSGRRSHKAKSLDSLASALKDDDFDEKNHIVEEYIREVYKGYIPYETFKYISTLPHRSDLFGSFKLGWSLIKFKDKKPYIEPVNLLGFSIDSERKLYFYSLILFSLSMALCTASLMAIITVTIIIDSLYHLDLFVFIVEVNKNDPIFLSIFLWVLLSSFLFIHKFSRIFFHVKMAYKFVDLMNEGNRNISGKTDEVFVKPEDKKTLFSAVKSEEEKV